MQRIHDWLEDPFEAASTRSARQRLRESNAVYGASNAQIRHERGADGQRKGLISTIKPYAETAEELSEEELTDIQTAAAEFPYLMQAFLGQSPQACSPEQLDCTFSAWQSSQDKGRFTKFVQRLLVVQTAILITVLIKIAHTGARHPRVASRGRRCGPGAQPHADITAVISSVLEFLGQMTPMEFI
jgi:hypothetical protein